MPKNNPLTPDIVIETLKRSNLQTVLIEGKDDLVVYRQIEEDLDFLNVDFLACNGRSNLLEVYKAKSQIDTKLLFICDSDLWIFGNRPEYITDGLISTNGYSIENELYQDGKTLIDNLFSKSELQKKNRIIDSLCDWFAYEVSLFLEDGEYDCKFSDVTILNTNVMQKKSSEFNPEFLESRNFKKLEDKDQLIFDKSNYATFLRGKFIFQVFEKLFQERPKKGIKYHKDQLFDIIYKNVSKSGDDAKILNIRKQEIIEFFS